MAVAEAAKIVFQTALAGTLESKGFRRVSDTNYVIEGDGIEWRVVFGPEYKDEPLLNAVPSSILKNPTTKENMTPVTFRNKSAAIGVVVGRLRERIWKHWDRG